MSFGSVARRAGKRSSVRHDDAVEDLSKLREGITERVRVGSPEKRAARELQTLARRACLAHQERFPLEERVGRISTGKVREFRNPGSPVDLGSHLSRENVRWVGKVVTTR